MTVFGRRVFADITKVGIDIRLSWISVGPKSSEGVLISDREGHTGEGHVKREAEAGEMWLQAHDFQGLPAATTS